jgi:hypothetical protein
MRCRRPPLEGGEVGGLTRSVPASEEREFHLRIGRALNRDRLPAAAVQSSSTYFHGLPRGRRGVGEKHEENCSLLPGSSSLSTIGLVVRRCAGWSCGGTFPFTMTGGAPPTGQVHDIGTVASPQHCREEALGERFRSVQGVLAQLPGPLFARVLAGGSNTG